jgi:hypothetical protein
MVALLLLSLVATVATGLMAYGDGGKGASADGGTAVVVSAQRRRGRRRRPARQRKPP